ncbi:Na+/H+ antiporter NhaC family protein [Myroides sp. 1354]|uniref:Na+/H+ antiporter NhaC family protein n=1 Tax=unclassified Myroides TaxID=2642485 RepID=UPI0025772EFF|nr:MULTISPECIES: Na+/H+ antiporter NhaC family protein [unclassified Myroides]MDM1046527.1 Na+/H+ antiporter NhaC family protein [Myroides sp. R163-1]MDM1057472.1 Na+/H+ antiporter NhaC family protein [Myroides sp. 1354]MDM1070757.1 Na+/H+ antiporter NhaC family protein [Myroides sp. 1372]
MSENKFYTLIPFFVFVAVFLGSGIALDNFYQLPSPIAISLGIITAFILFYKTPINDRITALIEGCGDSKIVTMCLIYLLAGAFATITKAIGGVDAMVNIGLHYIPVAYLGVGIFVISCFLSLSIGTSVGTIVALGPIVVGLAEKTSSSMGLLCGALLGGAMFGDNLSIISDTTITATQTMGCEMKDKFKANFKIAIPAAILTVIILIFMKNETADVTLDLDAQANYVLLIPYILTIVLALVGIQVFVALFIGILSAGIIGLVQADFDLVGLANHTYEGFTSMTEIFLLSMLTGGLARMIERQGGIAWILKSMQKRIRTSKGAVFGIASLVSGIGVCMANNTVSILVAGNLANDVATEYKLNRPYVASVLDIFACIIQGILPYGAQILILLSFTNKKLGYMELVSHGYYFAFLLIVTLFYMICFRKEVQTT